MRAINLLTRLNWEARVAAAGTSAAASTAGIGELANELADYLLFVGEAAAGGAADRARRASRRPRGAGRRRTGRADRSAQLDLTTRLMRYPCSYMIYSEAFDGLPAAVKQAVYARMLDVLSSPDLRVSDARVSAADRRAVLEILRETKPDFPGHN